MLSPCWINPFNIAVKSTLSDTDIATLFHKKKKNWCINVHTGCLLASFHFQPTYTFFEVSCFYAVYLQILSYLLHQLCLLNGVFRPFTCKVIIDMLGLNTAILLSFCFLLCFKPYCALYEHFFRIPSFLFTVLLKELFFIGLFFCFLLLLLLFWWWF